MTSRPAFAPRSGTVLILGSAPCVMDDFQKAVELRPEHEVMALNEAGAFVRDVQHLLCGHHDKAAIFLAYRKTKFPTAKRPLLHACDHPGRIYLDCIDYLWTGIKSGGSAALTGLRLARQMGYEEAILCGCPMDSSGYYNDGETRRIGGANSRIGYEEKLAKSYRIKWAESAGLETEGAYSMSGFTMNALGYPPALPEARANAG